MESRECSCLQYSGCRPRSETSLMLVHLYAVNHEFIYVINVKLLAIPKMYLNKLKSPLPSK